MAHICRPRYYRTEWGGSGHDAIRGGRGNDWIAGGAGSDRMFGGPGRDTIADVQQGGCTYGFIAPPGSDRVFGGPGDDEVHAGLGPLHARGGPGDDYLWGSGGDDLLDGGAGQHDQALAFGGNGDRCPRVERRRDCEFT
jgi:Ca2+-binding RTX toxin-like protein